MMTTWLIAPPGTRIGYPGWFRPPPGLVLHWDVNGQIPPFAVSRNSVLLSSGIPLAVVWPEWSVLPKCPCSQLPTGEHELSFYDTVQGKCSWCDQTAVRCPECLVLLGLHHDPGCSHPCEACTRDEPHHG
jgi:hypothetical protein